jgi:hypothetical protein
MRAFWLQRKRLHRACGSLGSIASCAKISCSRAPRAPADPTPRAGVAQLVEQLIRNQQVVRSTRIAGSIQNQLLTAITTTRRLIIPRMRLGCALVERPTDQPPHDWRRGSGWWADFCSDSVKLRFNFIRVQKEPFLNRPTHGCRYGFVYQRDSRVSAPRYVRGSFASG